MTELSAAVKYDRTPVRWRQGSEMTALEAAMWRADADAMLRSASVVVEILDVTPEWERLLAGHAMGLGRVPRLRQRVVEDPLRLGPPAWVDTRVDLAHHVRRVQLAEGASLADVLEVAAAMHVEPFAPERPLWQAALVEGLPDGRAAYILKLHHAMADSQAIVALFDLIHSRVRAPTTGGFTLPAAPHDAPSAAAISARHALRATHELPATAARAAIGTVRAGRSAVQHPRQSLGTAVEVVRFVGSRLGANPGRPSPLLRARDVGRTLDALDLPADALRAAGTAVGGSLGDTVLAGVVDGIGRYHRALGHPVAEVPIAVPLTLRPDGPAQNRFARARILAPTTRMATASRIALLRERIATADARPRVDVLRVAAPVISRAPASLVGRLTRQATRPLALQAFTVRGLDRDAYLAGARVERMFSFAPTNGCAVAVTLTTHGTRCCLGLTYDAAAVTDPAAMGRALREAFTALLDGTDAELVAA